MSEDREYVSITAPWPHYDDGTPARIVHNLVERWEAVLQAARALAEATGNYEYMTHGQERGAILDAANAQVEAVERLLGMGPGVKRWGLVPSPPNLDGIDPGDVEPVKRWGKITDTLTFE
jgi:hypothetical protein